MRAVLCTFMLCTYGIHRGVEHVVFYQKLLYVKPILL